MVGQTHLAGPWGISAADEGDVTHRVVGGAEGARSGKDRRGVSTGNAGDALDGEHRKPLFVVEGRKNPGEAARKHRLADARRPQQEQVVPAGGCNFEGSARERLTTHIGKFVEARGGACRLHIARGIEGASLVEGIGDFGEVVGDANLQGAGAELEGRHKRRFSTD